MNEPLRQRKPILFSLYLVAAVLASAFVLSGVLLYWKSLRMLWGETALFLKDFPILVTVASLTVLCAIGIATLHQKRLHRQIRAANEWIERFIHFGDLTKQVLPDMNEPLASGLARLISLFQDMHATLIREVRAREIENESLLEEIERTRRQMREQTRQLNWQINHDHLTGLPNRNYLVQKMEEKIRSRAPFAVLFLDLDGFKEVNDIHGHDSGDELLRSVGKRLLNELRDDDMVARLGGDEFVIIVDQITDERHLDPIMRRIIDCISTPFAVSDGKIARVSPSIGITFYPIDDGNADTLIRHADQAMYQAKQRGGSRYHVFDVQMDRNNKSLHLKYSAIESAFLSGEFTLFVHPKVNLLTGECLGAETLIRWRRGGEDGIALPGEFMPIIERTDLMLKMGRWIIMDTLIKLSELERLGLDHLSLSVNVTAKQFQDKDFIKFLKHALRRHQLEDRAGNLEIEIVETAALGDLSKANEVLGLCRNMGVRIAIDDFGDGYASLSYLSSLECDTIKIDRQFVSGILESERHRAVVQAIVNLGQLFGKDIVAEGVETVEQGVSLIKMGCRMGQGFVIAKPMPFEQFPDWLSKWSPPKEWIQAGKARMQTNLLKETS